MSWRTVVISERCKLDLSMGYMVVRGEETQRIFIDEIAELIIENTAVSLTACLLSELTEKKVKVVFCDSKRNPQAELIPYYANYESPLRIKQQINWSEKTKADVWAAVITEKISKQAEHLRDCSKLKEFYMLQEYISQIQPGDENNREGHAAKVYFNAVFGKEFSRSDSEPVNAALNYGYSLILSAFNREIVMQGYLTQIGIHHKNQFNQFNLSSDLMEPYRIFVDRKVKESKLNEFGKDEKHMLIHMLGEDVDIDGRTQTLLNSVKIYVRSVTDALNNDDSTAIKFYQI